MKRRARLSEKVSTFFGFLAPLLPPLVIWVLNRLFGPRERP